MLHKRFNKNDLQHSKYFQTWIEKGIFNLFIYCLDGT